MSLQQVLAITWKDILSEMRTREIIFSVLVFTLLVIVIFNFAFQFESVDSRDLAPGMLWVTFAFAGVLSLNRAFVPEKEENCLEGLMACPVSREVIYAGKALGSLLFMLVIEAIALPVFSFLFNLNLLSPALLLITFLTTVGFVSVGTLFSGLAINTRARELVLPVLFFPIVIPLIISALQASSLVLAGADGAEEDTWLGLIVAFDAIFIVASYLTFSYVIEE